MLPRERPVLGWAGSAPRLWDPREPLAEDIARPADQHGLGSAVSSNPLSASHEVSAARRAAGAGGAAATGRAAAPGRRRCVLALSARASLVDGAPPTLRSAGRGATCWGGSRGSRI